MIRYTLQCKKGHAFDGWFANSDAFEAQAKKKLLACPTCGSKAVTKALMAPGVVTSEAKAAARKQRRAASVPVETPAAETAPVPAETAAAARVALPPEMQALVRKLREEVRAKAEYVGSRFPEEARKIHHEEAPARGIYGEATAEEARALLDEGIEFLPLPSLPEDHN